MNSKIKLVFAAFRHRRRLLWVIYKCLSFWENPGQSLWGSISSEDREAVAMLTEKASVFPGPIIEVGTLFGLTTALIADHKAPGRKVISIDNYSWNSFGLDSGEHREFTRRVLYHFLRAGEVELYDGTSAEYFRTYSGSSPSLVFIDGAHEYEFVKADIMAALGFSARIVSGHDYNDLHPGVKRAVDECFPGGVRVIGSVWWSEASTNSP
jgi:hypothetical protein